MNSSIKSILVKVLLLAGLLLLAGSAYWLFGAEDTSQPVQKTVKPIHTTIEQVTTATGQIIPRQKVKIKSQANGVLEEFLVKPGQWVKRGDLIAKIGLRADPVEINTVQTQINKAKLEYQRAAQEFERLQNLHEQRMIPDSQFQDVRLRFDLSKSALDQAQRELELRMKGTSQQMKATSTLIVATVDGMVLDKPAEIGDFIIKTNDLNEGTTVVTIADMHNLIFKGDIEEADAGRMKEGMPLFVKVGALPNQNFAVHLEAIAPEARKTDQGRLVFEIRAAIPAQHDVTLRAGYSATAKIVFARHENVLAIPESSMLFRDKAVLVKIEAAPGSIVEKTVTTGLSDGFNIEILSGISEQDLVVIPDLAGAK